MVDIWDEARVQQYIDDGVEESLNLDYKAAGALAKTDGKRKEVTKDVSAMANSDGGIIIYGVTENGHLPGNIDPVNRQEFSKEWLEHVISNIRPRIDNLKIHPVTIGSSDFDVVYIVEIPQSHTAHQATDNRYYKRHNFESVPVQHYEILDILNRQQHPRIELRFTIAVKTIKIIRQHELSNFPLNPQRVTRKSKECELRIALVNTGKVFARFVEAIIKVPNHILHESKLPRSSNRSDRLDPGSLVSFKRRNTRRDVVGVSGSGIHVYPNYGPARHVPVFPDQNMAVDDIRLIDDFSPAMMKDCVIAWTTYADNALPRFGEVTMKDVQVVKETDTRFK